MFVLVHVYILTVDVHVAMDRLNLPHEIARCHRPSLQADETPPATPHRNRRSQTLRPCFGSAVAPCQLALHPYETE